MVKGTTFIPKIDHLQLERCNLQLTIKDDRLPSSCFFYFSCVFTPRGCNLKAPGRDFPVLYVVSAFLNGKGQGEGLNGWCWGRQDHCRACEMGCWAVHCSHGGEYLSEWCLSWQSEVQDSHSHHSSHAFSSSFTLLPRLFLLTFLPEALSFSKHTHTHTHPLCHHHHACVWKANNGTSAWIGHFQYGLRRGEQHKSGRAKWELGSVRPN